MRSIDTLMAEGKAKTKRLPAAVVTDFDAKVLATLDRIIRKLDDLVATQRFINRHLELRPRLAKKTARR